MSIFSTYKTGENRITASIMAVLASLSLKRMNRLLGALLEQSEFELVQFKNQPSEGANGVPDAMIRSNVCLLVETKIKRKTVNEEQIKRHLKRLKDMAESDKLLLVLTPDESMPEAIEKCKDDRIAWSSFSSLNDAIDDLLEDPREVVSDREAFLLRELQQMFDDERLVGGTNDVAIVAARLAWKEYNKYHAYICQAKRAFRSVKWLGFYSKNNVYRHVPRILKVQDNVEICKGQSGEIGALVKRLMQDDARPVGGVFKVMLLAPPDDRRNITLAEPIPNDKKSKSGKNTAYTMSQRYVKSDQLKAAKWTSDLE